MLRHLSTLPRAWSSKAEPILKKLSGFFYRFSTGWVALIGLLIFLVFSLLTLPAQTIQTDAYSHGLGSPDTSLFYDSGKLIQMAEVYGEEGRAAYLQARWGFDLAFPIIYTFFLITSTSFLFKKSGMSDSKSAMLNLVPLAALILDLAENTTASVVMASYPLRHGWAESLAPIFTPLKWFFVALCILLVFFGLLNWLGRAIIKQGKRTKSL